MQPVKKDGFACCRVSQCVSSQLSEFHARPAALVLGAQVHALRPDKQRAVATETLQVWCSLAERLGMFALKARSPARRPEAVLGAELTFGPATYCALRQGLK